MPKKVIFIRVLVFSVCIMASAILLMLPREHQTMAGSDVKTKTSYGFPLTWRTHSPTSASNASSSTSAKAESDLDSQKLIINLLILGTGTTFLLLGTSALEKYA